MNPIVMLLAHRALKFLVATPRLLPLFSDSLKAYKAQHLQDAEIQALPDDAAAIRTLAEKADAALRENADIQARLRERAAAETRLD